MKSQLSHIDAARAVDMHVAGAVKCENLSEYHYRFDLIGYILHGFEHRGQIIKGNSMGHTIGAGSIRSCAISGPISRNASIS